MPAGFFPVMCKDQKFLSGVDSMQDTTAPHFPQEDPAITAAKLMQRMGFLTLLLLLPFIATLSRRAGVVLFPTAIGFFLVSLIFSQRLPDLQQIKKAIISIPALSAIIILIWCVLSLLWSPHFDRAFARINDLFFVLACFLVGYWAIPERVKASNINFLPIGVFLAIASHIMIFSSDTIGLSDTDLELSLRGQIILLLFLWPAVSWLWYRNYRFSVGIMIILAGMVVFFNGFIIANVAFIWSIIIFLLTLINRKITGWLLGLVIIGFVLLAPLFGFLPTGLVSLFPEVLKPDLVAYQDWWSTIQQDPLRLVTGYGLEAYNLKAIYEGWPHSLGAITWIELGIVGVVGVIIFAVSIIFVTLQKNSLMAPGIFATLAVMLTCSQMGIRVTQSWLVISVAALFLVFISAQRSPFKTQRPLAFFTRKSSQSDN